MRRSQTPNPELSSEGVGMNTPQRRAITPGPEWGHPGHYNSNEDLAGARDNAAHYRQPSYLTAMDTVDYRQQSYPPTSGYDNNPYGTVTPSRNNYSASSVSGGSSYNGSHTLPARGSSYYPVKQTNVPQYTTSTTSTSQHYTQSHNQPVHSNRQYPTQAQQYPNQAQQYPQPQYPSQHQSQPTVGYNPNQQPVQHSQSYTSQGHTSLPGQNRDIPTSYQGSVNSNSHIPSRTVQSNDLCNQGYDDWTLSNSEQYRRTTPVSPTKEKSRFVYPTSPQRSAQPTVAKVNEVHRIDSFTKRGNGADIVRYPKSIHDEYPLEHYQRNRSHSQDGILGTGGGPYGEVSKSQDSGFQSAMKRAKSLENTAAAAEQAAATIRTGAAVSRSRPASARPYDYGHQKPVVHQHGQPPRSASTQPDKQPTIVYPEPEYVSHEEIMKQTSGFRGNRGMDNVDGPMKPAKSSLHPHSKGSASSNEDNYATFNMRKQVENILHLQNRIRPKSSAGHPSSSTPSHASSNTSLDTMSTGFKDTLQVDIPGDNISIGSNMSKSDSGYRSGDRNSASSASSGVDSPQPEGTRQYGKTAFVYGSYDPKAAVHSSNDSLDSAQSGQSCVTLTNKSTNGQHLGNIPENVATGYASHVKDLKRPDPSISPAVSAAYIAQQGTQKLNCFDTPY